MRNAERPGAPGRSETIDAASPDGRVLRVEFIWRGDRYVHCISLVEPSGEVSSLLESIEGDPDDVWPSSPPLQSLSLETRPDGRQVALLVGMAGGSHWSASIEALPNAGELAFDIACRHTKQPAQLGSQYQRLSACTAG